jgi:hypothetical protein
MTILKIKFIFDKFFNYALGVRADQMNINNNCYFIILSINKCSLIRRIDSIDLELKNKYQ